MGCVDSTIHNSDIYSLLNENTKERFRTIIAEDDLVELVKLESTTNYPTCLELSENGLLWTTIHFCCRFDAPLCLDYFLKKCYLQNMKQYVIFVNQPTLEGFTCLHLCATWGSDRCFALLVKYGGLNLTLRDKMEKSVFNIVHDYGRKDMEATLTALWKKYGNVTRWFHYKLEESPDIKLMKNPKFYKEEIRKAVESFSLGLELITECLHKNDDEAKLREEKGKLEVEKEKIRQEMARREKEQAQKAEREKSEKEKKEENEKSVDEPEKAHVKTEQELELAEKLRQKEEQVERIKEQLENIISMETNRKLVEQTERANKQQRNMEEILAKFQQFKQHILTFEKKPENPASETIEKNLEEEKTIIKQIVQVAEELNKTLVSEEMKHFHLFPEAIQKKYHDAKKKGKFIDEEFPHTEQSLGGQEHRARIMPFLQSLVWLRPAQFLSPEFKLFDGIDPNDIKQGQLGVCYCLATISALAKNPENIKIIFQFYDLKIGFYVLRFYTHGKINYVVLDDYFPCNSTQRQPLFSKPIGNQIWVLLIEKAWSKIVGSYFAAELMTPDLFMEDLTGSPTYGAWFKDKSQKMKDILLYAGKNYPIVLTTGSKKIKGIVNNHAYSLLKVIEHNQSHIYKLRNPWGRFEWNGCYGDRSTLWTPELKQKCECVQLEKDDGIFFLSESELLEAFEYYSIDIDEQNCKYSYVEITSKPEENLYFTFTLEKDCNLALRLTQPFKRVLKYKDYNYSPVIFELGKIEGDKVKFLSQGNEKCFFGDKSVHISDQIFKHYKQGEYFIRVKVQWVDFQKYNSAVISIFCEESIKINKLSENRGQQLWVKLMQNFISDKNLNSLNDNISFCMQWMKGQMICYATMKETAKASSYRVKWLFNSQQLQNCTLAMNKTSESTIEYDVSDKKRSNLGTLNRTLISKGCHSGKVSIQANKIEE